MAQDAFIGWAHGMAHTRFRDQKGGEAWCFTIPGRALPRFTLYVEELKPRLFFL